MLHARIEELSEDINDSFKQLADYQIQTERKIDARFDKIETDIVTIKGDVATIKEDIATIKGDMVAMEGRMLDAFKQLLVMIDSRLPPSQG